MTMASCTIQKGVEIDLTALKMLQVVYKINLKSIPEHKDGIIRVISEIDLNYVKMSLKSPTVEWTSVDLQEEAIWHILFLVIIDASFWKWMQIMCSIYYFKKLTIWTPFTSIKVGRWFDEFEHVHTKWIIFEILFVLYCICSFLTIYSVFHFLLLCFGGIVRISI